MALYIVYLITSRLRISTKGHIACRAIIVDGIISFAAYTAADAVIDFCCGVHNSDFLCFWMGRTTPKIAPSRGDLDTHLIMVPLTHVSLPPQTASRSVYPVLQGSRTWPNRPTTDHATPSIARILWTKCMRCSLIVGGSSIITIKNMSNSH